MTALPKVSHRIVSMLVGVSFVGSLAAQPAKSAGDVEARLRRLGVRKIVAAAKAQGDARRGGAVFFQRSLACNRCHVGGEGGSPLGPDLTLLGKGVPDRHLVESVLDPSRVLAKGFEPLVIEQGEDFLTGFLVSQSEKEIVFRDAAQNYKERTLPRAGLGEVSFGKTSLMPAGLARLLTSEQQFFDLIRYLMAIRDGGAAAARDLEPDPSLYVARPLPAYEAKLDHAGLLRDLDRDAFQRGEKIYQTHCVNCHGTREEPGSLPSSLAFARGRFKNGSDPFTMYQTLTKGFGMMNAQTWMVPTQKYDVIHYIREEYLKQHNPSQYFAVGEGYLAGLPVGETRGPEPSDTTPWQQMDYGPNQAMTLEIGKRGRNFAYKGDVVRLDAGPGGISRGRHWMVFDTDTMRMAAAWSGSECIDWNSIHFNGRHAIHPRLAGDLVAENLSGPGFGQPGDGVFTDPRLQGRDQRRYGPLPRKWAQFRGRYAHGADTLFAYTVGATEVLEMPGVQVRSATDAAVYWRAFDIGPRDEDLLIQVAHRDGEPVLTKVGGGVGFGPAADAGVQRAALPSGGVRWNGKTYVQIPQVAGLNVQQADFTVTARIRTRADGTIFAQTGRSMKWMRDGLAWFVRGGRLAVDIGWVGDHVGEARVADGKWHDVALRYRGETGAVQLFVDGKVDGDEGRLLRKGALKKPVIRLGVAAKDFPGRSYFRGGLRDVFYFNEALTVAEIAAVPKPRAAAHWPLEKQRGGAVLDSVGKRHGQLRAGGAAEPQRSGMLVAGVAGAQGCAFETAGTELRLRVPAGKDRRRLTLWFAGVADAKAAAQVEQRLVLDRPARDLRAKTKGGPMRWKGWFETDALVAKAEGPFAVDVLKRPTDNPWFCRLRLTGFDFNAEGDGMVVSAWDGSIWQVRGLKQLDGNKPEAKVRWRRIASGLFQPLGVKIVEGKTYITCRDQICILHDRNDDGEIDYYECFNNDHQVTDHFHEFAMGLQVDGDGNFYYAKSARHALPALVPHHGTLLKVSKDGQRTEIVANGFRAANGVCINPDGTFIVTDQEGHWNPKNRINYVKPGGFYGNMYGYHDVTDASDSAMEQPLVWITNSFDRSPGELLWVDSPRWGPLNKRLLNLSYGYGQAYIVPHETIDGQEQGGMCAFPIPRFPTGVMRGRFHPGDGQLYLAGMFAWAGSQQQPGGLYRLRYTGTPVHLPVELRAKKGRLEITFSGKLDPASLNAARAFRVKAWDLKRTKRYGSKHFNERPLKVTGVTVAEDGRTVTLTIPEIAPTWCMEVRFELKSATGKRVIGKIHNTIHKLGR